MPTAPLIPFRLELTTDDPDLFVSGHVFKAADSAHPVKRDLVVKTTWPAREHLTAGDYAYSFNFSKKGKIKLAAVTAADPQPAPEEFEAADNDGRFGRVFYFVVTLP